MPNLSPPIAKDDKIVGLIPLEDFLPFPVSYTVVMVDVGNPSASSICPFETLDLLHKSSLCKSILIWTL